MDCRLAGADGRPDPVHVEVPVEAAAARNVTADADVPTRSSARQAEAEASRQRAERDIASARDQALVEIWSKTAELAVTVAGRVLARDLGPDEHRRLIEVAINELPAAPSGQRRQGGVPA